MRSDEELARALVEASRSRPRAERACPAPEVLLAAGADELAPREHEELLAHCETCADCAAELALALRIAELAREAALAHDSPARPPAPARPQAPAGAPARRMRRWLPLAAALALAAGVALWQAPWQREDALRGAKAPAWIVVPADGAVVGAAPTRFSWPAAGGAASYDFHLFDAALRPLARFEQLSSPDFTLPAEVRPTAGGTYYWRVVVRRQAHEERSPLFAFSVEP